MKLACIHSDSQQAKDSHNLLSKRYGVVPCDEAEVIVVLGGDGLMLHSLHKFVDAGKRIYGMNCGTVGFLLNEFSLDNLTERIEAANRITLHPLHMLARSEDGGETEEIAFNEVSIIRYCNQTANLRVMVNGVERISKYVGDGIMVSTPAGSTAYNLSAHGPILPLGSNVLAVTPVSPFRPRRWHGALISNDSIVEFINLDPRKRPIGAAADFHEVRNAVSVKVREDRSRSCELLFDPNHSLEERIFNEQFSVNLD